MLNGHQQIFAVPWLQNEYNLLSFIFLYFHLQCTYQIKPWKYNLSKYLQCPIVTKWILLTFIHISVFSPIHQIKPWKYNLYSSQKVKQQTHIYSFIRKKITHLIFIFLKGKKLLVIEGSNKQIYYKLFLL